VTTQSVLEVVPLWPGVMLVNFYVDG